MFTHKTIVCVRYIFPFLYERKCNEYEKPIYLVSALRSEDIQLNNVGVFDFLYYGVVFGNIIIYLHCVEQEEDVCKDAWHMLFGHD